MSNGHRAHTATSSRRLVHGLSERWGAAKAATAHRDLVREGSARGVVWSVVVALQYYLLSNPVVLIPLFDSSLSQAIGLALLLVLWEANRLRFPVLPWSVVAFLGFAALSMAWSVSRDDSWTAIRLYILIAVMAVLIGSNVRPRVLAQGLLFAGVIIVVASYYAHANHLPGADVPVGNTGFMAGVGRNRNILAYSLTPPLAAGIALVPRTTWGWLFTIPCVGICGLGIYLSESSTGAFTAFVVVGVVLAARLTVLGRKWLASTPLVGRGVLAVIGVVGVVGSCWLGSNFDSLTTAFGRDESLSGRVPLWRETFEKTMEVPLQGFGWGAVWPHPWQYADPNEFGDHILETTGVAYSHGHNAFMDVLPQVGFVGTLLLLVCFVAIIARGIQRLWRGHRSREDLDRGLLMVSLVAGLLMFGMTEPMATIPIGWLLLVVLATMAGSPNTSSTDGKQPQPQHDLLEGHPS